MAQGLMHLFILVFLVLAQASMLQARPAPPDDDDEGPSHHPYELGDVGQIFHELPDASQSFHELPDVSQSLHERHGFASDNDATVNQDFIS